jgi:hypothetical protein
MSPGGTLSEGYDDGIDEGRLTPGERYEIAYFMMDLWKKWIDRNN